MAQPTKELTSLDGEHFPSKEPKHRQTIVFVHFFGGSKSHLIRHIRLVNQLGYNAFAFNLTTSKWKLFKKFPLSQSKQFGIEHFWADEIREVLDFIEGEKIIFSFSNPSASALEAITYPSVRTDIKAMICDGGPFQDLLKCSWNLAKEEFGFKNYFLRSCATPALYLMWSPSHRWKLKESISKLPRNFPILSIRAWKDKLVPVSAIEAAFENADHTNLEVLELPKAGHLTGLRDCPHEYKTRVESFLESLA